MTLAVLLDADEVHSIGDALVNGWSLPLVPFFGLGLTLIVYLRGWWMARQTRADELPVWRAALFTAGILSLWMALASPIEALDDALLSAHMLQHFILMSVAPPLMILGAPVVPMLRGLPQILVRGIVGPLLRVRWLHAAGRFLLHPVLVWLATNIAYLGWHVPAMFELAVGDERIHQLEHLCFFGTCLAFWWVVLAPWPAQRRWPQWTVIPYLLSADILNTVLSAALVFAGKVLYPSYAAAERLTRMTAIQDQAAAGAGMWVVNSTVFLIPAVIMTAHLMQPKRMTGAAAAPMRKTRA
jgi:cytochrome c oxidase assembly factor CtaG